MKEYILLGDFFMLKIKYSWWIIWLKKNFFSIISIIFLISLIIFSETNFIAAKNGILLWAESVLPTLFPFFVATELLCNTNLIYILGKYLKTIVKKLFNVPGEGVMALLLGIISGYPTGAKVIVDLKEKGILNKEEAERLLAFTNNSGPLFILGTIGISFLNNKEIGYVLLITHILAALTVGILFRKWKADKKIYLKTHNFNREENKNLSLSRFGEILGNSIKKSILTILNIGGFIVMFSVIISILEESKLFFIISYILEMCGFNGKFVIGIIKGCLELTNGAKIVSLYAFSKFNIGIIAFLLGFGGLSVMLQVYSIVGKENISIKSYIYGKLLQGGLAFIYTVIILNFGNFGV